MSNLTNILDSFSMKDELNPKIWENPQNPSKAKMKSKVREALLKIAEEFIDFLGDDVFVEDVVLMGSLVNYNWSEYSDFDLHILVNFKQYEKLEDLYRELFDLKKKIFNDKHDIKIYGYDVELYAQGADDEHASAGVYSIMNDEWISVPKKQKLEIDQNVLKRKIKCWTNKIDDAVDSPSQEDDEKLLKNIKDKLKEYRKSGLEKNGEFSYENLVFKFLRRSGHIGKLFDKRKKISDKKLSLEKKIQESLKKEIRFILDEQFEDFLNLEDKVTDALANSSFLKSLQDIADDGLRFEYTPNQKIPYEPPVKIIQIALQYLGFSLPKWGVDGKFGPETKFATEQYQEKYGLTATGVMDVATIESLFMNLVEEGFDDSKLSSIEYEKTYNFENLTDQSFYEDLLKNLGAPVTDENLKFLYAWRQAEGKAGTYNPFNTTYRLKDSTRFNKVGVQNYQTLEDGLYATLKTLENGRYNCIINGLKQDIGAMAISKCESLETWGTGKLVSKVIDGYESGADIKIKPLA